MQRPGGKGSIQSAGCVVMLCKPSDKFHGGRRYGRPEDIIAAVEEAGYGASQKGADAAKRSGSRAADEELLKDKETPVLRRRLIASLCFLIPLMYVSMGHMIGDGLCRGA